jgi:protease-4
MSDFHVPPSRPAGSDQSSPEGAPPPSGQAPSPPPPQWPQPAPKGRSRLRRVLVTLVVLAVLGLLAAPVLMLGAVWYRAVSAGGMQQAVIRPGSSDQVVAVVEMDGVLGGAEVELAKVFCRIVRKDDDIKAVVVRVSSPGGGVSPCDQVYKLFKDLRSKSGKPLVVSMGGVAASGGYYISAPADIIVAEPTTITGSIGVIGQLVVLKDTLDKIGVKVRLLPSSQARAWKAAGNLFEEPADYQVAEFQRIIDEMHQRFENVVRQERKGKLNVTTQTKTYKDGQGKEFTVEETEPFNGRVFLADRAKKLGLVDQIGYLDDAIEEAAKLARLGKPKAVRYSPRTGLGAALGLGEAGKLRLDESLLDRVQTPKVLMVWKLPE